MTANLAAALAGCRAEAPAREQTLNRILAEMDGALTAGRSMRAAVAAR